MVDQVLVANVAPQITRFVVPTTGKTGGSLRLVGLATDPAGNKDALVYTWLITGPKGYSKALIAPTVNWTPPAIIGKYTVKLTVTDGDGGRAVQSSAITITSGQLFTRSRVSLGPRS